MIKQPSLKKEKRNSVYIEAASLADALSYFRGRFQRKGQFVKTVSNNLFEIKGV